MAEWPMQWEPPEGADAQKVERAEMLAARTMRQLTLDAYGGEPVTVMPCARTCCRPYMRQTQFYPILLDNGMIGNCWCSDNCNCGDYPTVRLAGPVGRIDEVRVNGVVIDPAFYRVIDGLNLERLDGFGWPACSGSNFTVTYLNAYEVDEAGEYAGGIMANEYLLALTDERKCRLPAEITSMARQGMSLTFPSGMFPDMLTGIREVDVYLRSVNPNGLRVMPRVYSVDRPRNRQVTW